MEAETLTVRELSKYLRVSRQTIYTMIRAGKLPHFRIGNKVRFKKADIDAMTNTKPQEKTSE